MADFCYQCTEKFLGINPDRNDMRGLTKHADWQEGLAAVVLCEGCGSIQVDPDGKCISEDCLEKHNARRP